MNCKTFLFPTLYEGFGIPPLEALLCGAGITVSDTPCMHEIYQDSATYIDPYNPSYKAEDIIGSKDMNGKVTSKFSWKQTAKSIVSCIRESEK